MDSESRRPVVLLLLNAAAVSRLGDTCAGGGATAVAVPPVDEAGVAVAAPAPDGLVQLPVVCVSLRTPALVLDGTDIDVVIAMDIGIEAGSDGRRTIMSLMLVPVGLTHVDPAAEALRDKIEGGEEAAAHDAPLLRLVLAAHTADEVSAAADVVVVVGDDSRARAVCECDRDWDCEGTVIDKGAAVDRGTCSAGPGWDRGETCALRDRLATPPAPPPPSPTPPAARDMAAAAWSCSACW